MTNAPRDGMFAILITDEKTFLKIKAQYAARNDDDPRGVSDWQFFASKGHRYIAVSPSLGVSRHLSVEEEINMPLMREDMYEVKFGKAPDPLSAEALEARNIKERVFHLSVSYSTVANSPEDALATFFEAAKTPGAMVAEIYESGVTGVTEIDGDEIVRIAAAAGTGPGEPS